MSPLPFVLVMLAVAMVLMLAGFLIMLASVLWGEERRGGEGRRAEGGAVVVVGPLPIVVGTSERVTRLLMVLAIALLVASVVAYLVTSRGAWR